MKAKQILRSTLFLFMSSLFLTLGCKDMKLDIQDLKDRLDVMEGTTIRSINEQISAINTSISGLKEMDESLDAYIKTLAAISEDLQKQINDANAEIAKFETELGEDISNLEQNVLNQLNTAKEAIEAELLAINSTLAELKQEDESLDKKISDLKTYVDTQLISTTNWANATFSTLAQYEQTQTEISTIKALIEQINASMTALETSLNGKIAADIQTAVDALRSELSTDYISRIENASNAVTQAYTAAISSAKDEITAAYTAAIATAIKESEANLKTWVNEQLVKGYYDIATIDGKLSALSARLGKEDADLQKQIEDQNTALAASREELAMAYEDAIKEAIEENNGVVSAAITSALKEVEDKLREEIYAINLKVKAMVDSLTGLMEAFDNRIQSIKFIPEFSDRKVKLSYVSGAVLQFMVAPENQAAALTDAWDNDKGIVKAYLRYTSHPSTRAECEPIELSVTLVAHNNKGEIAVVVKENVENPITAGFWTGNEDAVIYLRISDGSNDIVSEMIDVVGCDDSSVVLDGANLSEVGTANCYIVSEAGEYKFATVRGNSNDSVGDVVSAEVLWTDAGELIKSVSYSESYIIFHTAEAYKEGNALIAAKDAFGNILWSWHIWFTDKPEEQVYYNDAGTMMDRNLGAISVGDFGAWYQWGRKDPFSIAMASYSFSIASSNSTTGTIEYVTANPTTFIASNRKDWYYSPTSSIENTTRWTTSEAPKSIYDPCPVGWRVPDGGANGVWSKALGSSSDFHYTYDSMNYAMNFTGKFGSDATILYPATGFIYNIDGTLYNYYYYGYYWSASPGYAFYFDYNGDVIPNSGWYGLARGFSVRCANDGSAPSMPSEPEAVNLSKDGTANSYIVSEARKYKFAVVRGNSNDSVGDVVSAVVLWESFGTDVTPNVGELIKSVQYKGGYIIFKTADVFREGNAVIAAKDASGNILWSWHIWLTDHPEEQVYYNDAGTMMDRNLGAISATPGNVGALGLFYQWGRKDPFLGSSSIRSDVEAKSTITWPTAIGLDLDTDAIAYAIANPTTFITKKDGSNGDWCYSDGSTIYNTRWTTSEAPKSIYDPCPVGWRVPDGGADGIWSKALGSSSGFDYTYDSINCGMNFTEKFGSDATIWYPASGLRNVFGEIVNVVDYGYSWSASSRFYLQFNAGGRVLPFNSKDCARGQAVRCQKEN